MFRFNREKILAAFLQKQWSVHALARRAGVGYRSAYLAVKGKAVGATIIAKVADALGVDAVQFLADED